MRAIDSMTATVSSRLRSADKLAGVDQAGDVARAIDLGRPIARHPSASPAPSSCRRNRSSASRSASAARRSAPARAMPYIGLCGLLPVSFSERAGITAPLMFARVAGRDPLEDAAQERAVGVEREPELGIDEVVLPRWRSATGHHVAGQALLRIALRRSGSRAGRPACRPARSSPRCSRRPPGRSR